MRSNHGFGTELEGKNSYFKLPQLGISLVWMTYSLFVEMKKGTFYRGSFCQWNATKVSATLINNLTEKKSSEIYMDFQNVIQLSEIHLWNDMKRIGLT